MSGNRVSLVLGMICVGLIAGLIYRHTQATAKESAQQLKLETVQNELTETASDLNLSQTTNVVLRSELEETKEELTQVRQQFQSLSLRAQSLTTELAKEKARADAAIMETRAALTEVADRDAQIRELLAERLALSDRVESLILSLQNLQSRIDDTETKLTSSEGDREFLLRELKRLQTEKSGIERQFNDLSVLRAQLTKLRTELTLSRRIEWIRRGLIGGNANRKGAELLAAGFRKSVTRTNYNLNVEINQEGGVKILPQPSSISTPE